jgi:hypothetical protein
MTQTTWASVGVSLIAIAAAAAAILALLSHTASRAATEDRIDREVSALLVGIPQRERTLGKPAAPVTLEVFLDLKDPDCRSWFLTQLPAIIHDYVRAGALELEYRSYKTNTFSPQEFVKEQTAALAAGAQNKLWTFIYTFYSEQGNELSPYVTDAFLDNVARQVPGLNLPRWHADRHAGRREEQTTGEDHTANALGLHVTPSFRIGKTGSTMRDFSGHAIVKYKRQHPIALPTAHDIGKVIKELEGPQGHATARSQRRTGQPRDSKRR